MIGRKVHSPWQQIRGTVIRWEPLSSSMTDTLVRHADGSEVWISSRDLRPTDNLGALPNRQEAQEEARKRAQGQLQTIRRDLVNDQHRHWPGCEFGKAIIGRAIDGALSAHNRG